MRHSNAQPEASPRRADRIGWPDSNSCPASDFSTLYHEFRDAFVARFVGSSADIPISTTLAAFWNSVHPADPRLAAVKQYCAHKNIELSDYYAKAIPIVVHGDKVPAARFGLDTISWSGLLARTLSTIDNKILIASMVDKCKAANTDERFWEIAVWSLRALIEGKHPDRDWNGKPWSPGTPMDSMKGTPLAWGFGVCLVVHQGGPGPDIEHAPPRALWCSVYVCVVQGKYH